MLETSAKDASDSVRLCGHVGGRAAFQQLDACLALLPIALRFWRSEPRSRGIFEEVCRIVCFLAPSSSCRSLHRASFWRAVTDSVPTVKACGVRDGCVGDHGSVQGR